MSIGQLVDLLFLRRDQTSPAEVVWTDQTDDPGVLIDLEHPKHHLHTQHHHFLSFRGVVSQDVVSAGLCVPLHPTQRAV